MDWILGA